MPLVRTTLAAMFLLSAPAAASADYYCTGTVANLAIAPTGAVTTTIGEIKNVTLCAIGSTFNNVNSEACKAVHAQLLAATLANRQVRIYFNDNLTCQTHPSWKVLTGWYFGPEFVQ